MLCMRNVGIVSSEGRVEKKMMNSQRFFFGYFYFLGSRRMVMFVGFLLGVLHSDIPFSYLVSLRDFLGLLVLSLSN